MLWDFSSSWRMKPMKPIYSSLSPPQECFLPTKKPYFLLIRNLSSAPGPPPLLNTQVDVRTHILIDIESPMLGTTISVMSSVFISWSCVLKLFARRIYCLSQTTSRINIAAVEKLWSPHTLLSKYSLSSPLNMCMHTYTKYCLGSHALSSTRWTPRV